ncbi:DUF2304 domain-containing protein [Candidatus Falkowbacteria bacterium]|nr:DUF2304 domain-containing protein [Candidatus Falkowbacteria bacterium]
MSIIQLIIFLFVLIVIVKLIKRLRTRDISLPIFLLWLLFWIGAAAITWKTVILDRLADLVGVGRGADLVIYCSLLVLFYLIFRIFVRLDKQEKQISEIVRSIAKNNCDLAVREQRGERRNEDKK